MTSHSAHDVHMTDSLESPDDDQLNAYFPPFADADPTGAGLTDEDDPRIAYRDYSIHDVQRIRGILLERNPEWAKNPKTYILLRTLKKQHLMDTLCQEGFSDIHFPILDTDLPDVCDDGTKRLMANLQGIILDMVTDFERDPGAMHANLPFETLPMYRPLGQLGKKGHGAVQEIVSLSTKEHFARKEMKRRHSEGGSTAVMRIPTHELQALKRLRHRHIVSLLGSYTTPSSISVVMAPVANSDLMTFLEQRRPAKDVLASFFGCLVAGLQYLHSENIRHKTIKPTNILVHGNNVMFTDFGFTQDSIEDGTGVPTRIPQTTRHYSAPEVAAHLPGDSKSDIWSLGVVFIEMLSVLAGLKSTALVSHLKRQHRTDPFVSDHVSEAHHWLRSLENKIGTSAIEWTVAMLHEQPNKRPEASELLDEIGMNHSEYGPFTGACCCPPMSQDFAHDETDTSAMDDSPMFQQSPSPEALTATIGREPMNPSVGTDRRKLSRSLLNVCKKFDKEPDLAEVQLLLGQGADHGYAQKDGLTSLHYACRHGSHELVSELLGAGANVNIGDQHGCSAIHQAAQFGHDEVILLLLMNGASAESENYTESRPLSVAAEHGHLSTVTLLTKRHRCDVHAHDMDGGTALSWASWAGHLDIVRVLLSSGANVDVKDTARGRTPMSYAAEQGHYRIVEMLLAHKATLDPEGAANKRNELSYAAQKGVVRTVKALLPQAQATPESLRSVSLLIHSTDENGKSALDYAQECKNLDTTRILKHFLKYGHVPTRRCERVVCIQMNTTMRETRVVET